MKTKRVPTIEQVNAALPAIETLARTSPFAFAKVTSGEREPRVQVELPVPGTNPITITAEVAYGSQWRVEVSGWSWKVGSVDDLRTTAGVLNVAQGLVALLVAIA
jgi:hypothetical protein